MFGSVLLFVWISTTGGATQLVNSTSPLFGSTIILTDDAVKATYQKVLSCLSRSQLISSRSAPPVSDLEAHYTYLLKETERFRGVPFHDHWPYSGPWIENYWIDKFMSQPFSTFNGLVPLFVQWVDIHVYSFDPYQKIKDPKIPQHAKMTEYFEALLRKDVMYITVSQDDQGIGLALTQEYPNILVLSAGGYGHVPIPLIKGEIPYAAPPSDGVYTYQAGFYGTSHRLARHGLITELAQGLQQHGIRTELIERHPRWISNMEVWVALDDMRPSLPFQRFQKTLINLAPRGYGRTSYRLAEIIQCGRIPVYMYDDVEWLPYGDTNISVKSFGYSGRIGSLNSVADRIGELVKDPSAVQLTLEKVKAVRHHYTYEGVIEQIAMFLTDPFGPQGGNLACAGLPSTDHRL